MLGIRWCDQFGGPLQGSGFTSEGIDQNPALYDFLIGNNWRAGPVDSIPDYLISRAYRRYGMGAVAPADRDPDVASAWTLLEESMYRQDVSVQDFTGIHNLPGGANWDFRTDPKTKARLPADSLCKTFHAWSKLIDAAARFTASPSPAGSVGPGAAAGLAELTEPMRFDLVDLGRDVLARLTTPVSQQFIASLGNGTTVGVDAAECARAGNLYVELMLDLDTLVGTDQAFLLGSWLKMARQFAGDGAEDCTPANAGPLVTNCAEFYEWNARIQLTTWAGGYAGKHWNGLIKGYFAERVKRLMAAGLAAAAAGKPLPEATIAAVKDALDSEFTQGFNVSYPETPVGDPVAVAAQMRRKYSSKFSSCAAP